MNKFLPALIVPRKVIIKSISHQQKILFNFIQLLTFYACEIFLIKQAKNSE